MSRRLTAKFTDTERKEYEESLKTYIDIKNIVDTAKEKGKKEGKTEEKNEMDIEIRALTKAKSSIHCFDMLDNELIFYGFIQGAAMPQEIDAKIVKALALKPDSRGYIRRPGFKQLVRIKRRVQAPEICSKTKF